MNFLKGKYGDEQIDCSLDLSIDRTYRSNQELIMMRDDRSSNGYSESTYGDDKHSNHESLTTHHGGNLRQQGSKRDLSHDRNENDLKEEKWNGYCCWCCCPRIYSSNAITETNLQLNR